MYQCILILSNYVYKSHGHLTIRQLDYYLGNIKSYNYTFDCQEITMKKSNYIHETRNLYS